MPKANVNVHLFSMSCVIQISMTNHINFKDFSKTFKDLTRFQVLSRALNFFNQKSSTFKNFSSTVWTLILNYHYHYYSHFLEWIKSTDCKVHFISGRLQVETTNGAAQSAAHDNLAPSQSPCSWYGCKPSLLSCIARTETTSRSWLAIHWPRNDKWLGRPGRLWVNNVPKHTTNWRITRGWNSYLDLP
jgi:hypothetical protein